MEISFQWQKSRDRLDQIIEMTLFARSCRLNDTFPQTRELRKHAFQEDKSQVVG
jgi:hypothetical protein